MLIGLAWLYCVSTEFEWVFMGLIEFDLVLLTIFKVLSMFTGFYWGSLAFSWFNWVVLGCTEILKKFESVQHDPTGFFRGFNGFYWVLSMFTGFYWVFGALVERCDLMTDLGGSVVGRRPQIPSQSCFLIIAIFYFSFPKKKIRKQKRIRL